MHARFALALLYAALGCAPAEPSRSALPSAEPSTVPDTVEGVVHGTDQEPRGGVLVALMTPEGGLVGHVRTDASGRFILPRPQGAFALTATGPEGTAAIRRYGPEHRGAPSTMRLGPVAAGIRIHGTVALRSGSRPEPFLVAASRVDAEPGGVFFAMPSEDGAFELRVPPGEYFVQTDPALTVGSGAFVSGNEQEPHGVELEVSAREPAPEPVVAWTAAHAIGIASTRSDDPVDDLDPLRAALGEATIIGVGEATHGTAEFFTLKHRLFRALVETHGVTTLAMEANVVEAEAVDRFVVSGAGSVDEALGHLFLVWQTEEVRELLLWMRAYNANPDRERTLRFRGYDVQGVEGPLQSVRAYLSEAAPDELDLLAPYEGPTAADADGAAGTRLLRAFDDGARAMIRRSSDEAFARARRHAEVLVAAHGVEAAKTPSERFIRRDRAMAEGVKRIAERLGDAERVFVWAHNGHIRHHPERLLGHNMGTALRERFGEDYVSVGFVLNRGTYRAAVDREHPRDTVLVEVDASAPGYLAEAFSRVDADVFALDLRTLPAGPISAWFDAPHLLHSCGWLVSEPERLGVPGSIARWFDLVIYVDQTHGATPLR